MRLPGLTTRSRLCNPNRDHRICCRADYLRAVARKVCTKSLQAPWRRRVDTRLLPLRILCSWKIANHRKIVGNDRIKKLRKVTINRVETCDSMTIKSRATKQAKRFQSILNEMNRLSQWKVKVMAAPASSKGLTQQSRWSRKWPKRLKMTADRCFSTRRKISSRVRLRTQGVICWLVTVLAMVIPPNHHNAP